MTSRRNFLKGLFATGIATVVMPMEVWGKTAPIEQKKSSIPEINIRMHSVQVTAKTRKLRATWTPEIMRDLSQMSAIEEQELTQLFRSCHA